MSARRIPRTWSQAPALAAGSKSPRFGALFDVGAWSADARRNLPSAAINGAESFTDVGEAHRRQGRGDLTPPNHAGGDARPYRTAVTCWRALRLERCGRRAMLAAAENAGGSIWSAMSFASSPNGPCGPGHRAGPDRRAQVRRPGRIHFLCPAFAQDIPSWWFDPKTSDGVGRHDGLHVIDQVRAE